MDTHTKTWIADRVDNDEPLQWNAFISMMVDASVSDRTITRYRSKAYMKTAIKRYQQWRAKARK